MMFDGREQINGYSPATESAPSLVPGLGLHDVGEVHLLGEDVGLCPRVGDEALSVEPLSDAHGGFGAEFQFS